MDILEANLHCLHQGISFLEVIDADIYQEKDAGCFNSSVGGHIRHNLDHYSAFLQGYSLGEIDYDQRERNMMIERLPQAALAASRELYQSLSQIKMDQLDEDVRVRMDHGGGSEWSRSTVYRELQFLMSHTIHHYALVVAIGSMRGWKGFPEGFGIAPSTTSYRENCSR